MRLGVAVGCGVVHVGLAACGARSQLVDDTGNAVDARTPIDAASPADAFGPGDSPVPADAHRVRDAPAPDALTSAEASTPPPALPCTSWTLATGPTQVSNAPENIDLTTLAVGTAGPLLSWADDLLRAVDPHFRGRAVGWDGLPLGPEQVRFPKSARVDYWSAAGFVATATGFGAFAWDETDGCQFETLDALDAPSSPLKVLGTNC